MAYFTVQALTEAAGKVAWVGQLGVASRTRPQLANHAIQPPVGGAAARPPAGWTWPRGSK